MASPIVAGGYADYDLENQQLERRRKMAEMLQQQGGSALPAGAMVGNQYVPTSWTQHLAQALSGPLGTFEERNIDKKQRDLAQRKQAEITAENKRFAALLGGEPAKQQVSDDQLAYGGSPADSTITQMPAVAPDRRAALAMALEAKNPALQQWGLGVLTKEQELKAGKPGDVLYNSAGQVVTKLPGADGKFGTTPHYEKGPDGKTYAVYSDEHGNRKMVEATPVNQFTTGTVDAANANAIKMYQFNNLSAEQRAHLENEARKIGISARELYFNTGMGYTPQGATAPPNAPPPNFAPTAGQTQPLAAPTGAPAIPPRAPMGGQPVARPGARPSVQPVSNDRAQIFKDEYAAASNGLAQATARGDQANIERYTADIQNLQREMQNLGISQSGAQPGLTPKAAVAVAQEQAIKTADAARALPQVQQTAKNMSQQIDDIIGDLGRSLPPGAKARAPHPGFSTSVGMGMGGLTKFIPGTDAADFHARMDQVKGGTFLQAFESLKGGGQITEIEGEKATQALNRMKVAQSEKEFVTAAREFQRNLELGVKLAAQKAGQTMPSASAAAPNVRVVNW